MPANTSSKRRRGVLVDWNDQRGFGFIAPSDGGPRVFVHVSAFPDGPRPANGCLVTFTEDRDGRGRPRASHVRYLGTPPAGRGSTRGIPLALAAVLVFFGIAAALVAVDRLPVLVPVAYALLSVASFVLYGADKSAARQGRWRTPETALHVVDLLGGWPGGLAARRVFRHKTVKQPFRTIFWVTVVVNCAALAWFALRAPAALS